MGARMRHGPARAKRRGWPPPGIIARWRADGWRPSGGASAP